MTGLILLDKPKGITSFGAVAYVRRLFGEKRAGHTGTLDPMATGVLPILLGRSTRLCGVLLESDKRYTAQILLGTRTDTYDVTGNVLKICDNIPHDSDIISAANSFKGEFMQVPPIFSALKSDGKRLYDIARNGGEVDIEPRRVEIKQLNIISLDGNLLTVDVLCSNGTYIRSLAHDIGEALGCGATLKELRRTFTGGFGIEQCVTPENLSANPNAYLKQADECVLHLPAVTVTDNQRARYLHGGELFKSRVTPSDALSDGMLCRVYDRNGIFLGISEAQSEFIKVKCLIFEGDQP